MPRQLTILDNLKVASPCTADWDQMAGSERVRFCQQCKLNVYNLSEMSESDAETLLSRTEDRLCVRFHQRHDGTILTQDCPVGLRAIRHRIGRLVAGLAALVGITISGTACIMGAVVGWDAGSKQRPVPYRPNDESDHNNEQVAPHSTTQPSQDRALLSRL